MQLVVVEGIDATSVARSVDPRTFARGAMLARQRAVLHMEWDDEGNAVHALVRGSRGVHYETLTHFAARGDRLELCCGDCTCPVGGDCKHVVAVALAAAGDRQAASAVAGPDPSSWERELDTLLGPAEPATGQRVAAPLAVELTLVLSPTPVRSSLIPRPGPRLQARLVRPGRNGGWIAGGLAWSRLDSSYQLADCDPRHVRLLRELYALHRSRAGEYYYSASETKTIDLAGFGNRLWSFLDEAAEIGVQLVHPRKALGSLEPYQGAELHLDVRAAKSGAWVIEPMVLLAGQEQADPDVLPVAFLGADGHGLVYVSREQQRPSPEPADWSLRLARLTSAAPAALQRMVLEQQRLPVPDGQQARFRDVYYPRLRHLATVTSSDGAFVPPSISPPTLVLRASYGDGHDVQLDWEWSYQVGETQLRAPLDPSGAQHGFREPALEQARLAELDRSLDARGLCALGATPGRAQQLRGMHTMRFSTEVLPLLSDAPGVAVEVDGEPARYREAGDSLRIGLSTSAVAGDTDWFDLGVRITVEDRQVPFVEVFAALAAGESHLLLPDGAYFALDKPQLQGLRVLIEEARALQEAPGGRLRISRFQAGLWEELAALGVVDRQARVWKQQVTGLLALDRPADTPLPAGLTATLRPYQRAGFDWLCFLWRHRLGGILADDMGLGKTVQSLALICHAKQADPGMAPFLIVAPTSVLSNWAAEARRFAPGLTVVTVTDTLRRRGQELAEVVAGADVVVTSYTLFRLDIDAYAAVDWSGLVLDEAQFVKNHQSKVYQSARRLPAPFKLAITGTPMENNLMELWSLLSVTAPGLFPNPTRFRDTFARPIEKQADVELLARLRRRIKPLVKRRTKEQVAPELPAKQEQVLSVELDPKHRRIYQRHLQRERQKVLGLIDDVDRNRFTILRSITLLRQLSLHPGLIDAEHLALGSAKIDALLEQLDDVVAGGHRALVFSQFTGFLAQVRDRLDAVGVDYCYLDGSSRNRAAIVARFKDGAAPVFLVSLKAGGFGLNLTEADYCFLLDPWWNPATEAQAVDRTHRIGQTRNVVVYRMIAKDTIEEKVLALASRKAELFDGVMNEGNAFGSALNADDIRALVS
jgi:superfamily II DNA or RNA helicase